MAAVNTLLSDIDIRPVLPSAGTGTGAKVGTIVYPPRSVFGPREQRDYQLVFVHRGSVRVEVDGVFHTLDAGQVALLLPGRRELFQFDQRVETHHTWLAIRRPTLPSATLAALGALPFALPISAALRGILDAALAARGLSLDHPAGRPSVPAPLSLALLVEAALLRCLEEGGAPPGQSAWANSAPTEAAREYLHRHLHEAVALREVAAAASVAPEHLIRVFKRDTGLTPFRYLWQERVRVGVSLLESTGLPVGQVATMTGFRTVYHFSRLVRAATGSSPTALRRRAWQ